MISRVFIIIVMISVRSCCQNGCYSGSGISLFFSWTRHWRVRTGKCLIVHSTLSWRLLFVNRDHFVMHQGLSLTRELTVFTSAVISIQYPFSGYEALPRYIIKVTCEQRFLSGMAFSFTKSFAWCVSRVVKKWEWMALQFPGKLWYIINRKEKH